MSLGKVYDRETNLSLDHAYNLIEMMDTPVAPSAIHRVTPKIRKLFKNKQNYIYLITGECSYVLLLDSFYLLVDIYFDITLLRVYLGKITKQVNSVTLWNFLAL